MILEYNATDGPEMNAKTWPLGHKTVPEASGRRRGRQSDSLGWTGAFIIQIGDERHGRGVWDGSKVVPRKNQKVQPGLARAWYHGKRLGIRLRRGAQRGAELIIHHMVETRGSRLQTRDWSASEQRRE